MSGARQLLIDARELIEDPVNWLKGTSAAKADGGHADYDDPEACKFCSTGALEAATLRGGYEGWAFAQAFGRLEDAVPSRQIVGFNDADTTTHEDVLALFDRAIEATP